MATTSANICPVDIISKPAWRQEMTKKSDGLYMRMYLQWQNQDVMNVIFKISPLNHTLRLRELEKWSPTEEALDC